MIVGNDHSGCVAAYCATVWRRRADGLASVLELETVQRAAALLTADPRRRQGAKAKPTTRARSVRWLAEKASLLTAFPFATDAEFDAAVRRLVMASHDLIAGANGRSALCSEESCRRCGRPLQVAAPLSDEESLRLDADRLFQHMFGCPDGMQPIPYCALER